MVPDFVIAGEPKSGTTALYTYLAGHPSLAASRRKDPGYWSTDVPRGERVDAAAYAALWDGAPAGALRFEASTTYLRSRVAVPAIRTANPAARFVAMLRNPVEMAQARHAQFVKDHQEDVGDFERAWRLQERRARGEAMPPECVAPEILMYEEACAIGDHLERFFAAVPESHRLVVVFDDFTRDPAGQYRRVLRFVGVEDDGRTAFPRVNANVNVRSAGLARLHRGAGRRLGRLYGPARRAARAIGISPSAIVDRVNLTSGERHPMRPEFRAELAETFAPQVAKVSELLGRDLSHWR